MSALRTVIVDDERLARQELRALLTADHDVEVIGECDDGASALKTLPEITPDVVFLDIQMPGIDGFEMLDRLDIPQLPVIVFVTAYHEHALRAFRVHAVDYLLKPVTAEAVGEAVRRARDIVAQKREGALEERVRTLVADVRESELQRIMVKSGGRVIFLRTTDVDWIEADGDYACLHTQGKKHLIRARISELETRLPSGSFVRIHRSIIVNTGRIKEMQPLYHGDYAVLLLDGTRLTMTRSFRERVFQKLSGQP
jgi:two-component system, LytTR family, response regulator